MLARRASNISASTCATCPASASSAMRFGAFVYSKAKNVPAEFRGQFGKGDVWTWTAIDADTKLVPCWHVGTRGIEAATTFMRDLASRLVESCPANHRRPSRLSECRRCSAFDGPIDYAMLVKHYAASNGRRDALQSCGLYWMRKDRGSRASRSASIFRPATSSARIST